MKLYVVTAPPSLRGICDRWSACETMIAGVAGARYQSVASRDGAEGAQETSVGLPGVRESRLSAKTPRRGGPTPAV